MHSRVSLSLLAMVFGAAVLYVVEYYGLISLPEYKANLLNTLIVAFGGLCCVIGWFRIFRRRPGQPSESSTDEAP